MVEGDASDREQQHADQAHRGADPVPLVQGAQPVAATLLLGGLGVDWGQRQAQR